MEFNLSAVADFVQVKHLTRHGYSSSISSALIPSAGALLRPLMKKMNFAVFAEETWVPIDLAGLAVVLMSSIRLALMST